MIRQDVPELYYLTPMTNLGSILSAGILSHNRAKNLDHESVAMQEIQDRRKDVVVPGGRRLHEYANLYFCVRNPMMYKRQNSREALCVLRICHHVLDLPNTVITDANAAGTYTKFEPSPSGLQIVDAAMTHATYWNTGDQIERWRRTSAKCAEVLVPDRIDVRYILGAYVCSATARATFTSSCPNLTSTISGYLFFA